MGTIDHPLSEAIRVMESGFLEQDAIQRAADEWRAGPLTAARLRESVFEILGLGWRGCLPVAIEDVIDPELAEENLGVRHWAALGVVDDASVLKLADGSWLLGVTPPDDREMVVFGIDEEGAQKLSDDLDAGRKPVWVRPAVECLPMGSEREYRAFMADGA